MKLQSGTVEALYHCQMNNPLYSSPVLQITTLSKFSFGSDEKYRYKANLSDGTYYMKAVFSSELLGVFDNNEISKFCLVRLDKFVVRPKDNSSYLYIQGISLCERLDSEIGSSVNISNGKLSLDPSGTNRSGSDGQAPKRPEQTVVPQNNTNTKTSYDALSKRTAGEMEAGKDNKITEIKNIFPQKKPFKLKGRVVSKSEIRSFTSQKGEGKVFSFEVADCTGQIKCVCFSECADMFYPVIENNKVYTIANVSVRPSNKKFSNSTSDFEIHLERNSEVARVGDEGIPVYMFKFVKLSDLAVVGGTVDCLVVVKDVYPAGKIVSKSTGRENSKRDLVVMDQSGSCRLTIWGPRAEEEYEKDTVICLGSVKVSEYNGINLSTISNSQVIINIDLPEAVSLLAWYEENGKNVAIERPKRTSRVSMVNEVKDNSLEYATIQATVMYVKEDGLYYAACPSENCSKKVSMEDNGMYRCEKCNYTFERCNYRYMISLQVGDFTGQMWITVFDEAGKALFGMSAEQLKEMGDHNPEDMHSQIKKICSRDFQFRIKNREENYNGDIKLRSTCMDITAVDTVFDVKRMLEMIEKASV